MPRSCSVCSHEEAFEINEALILEGRSNRRVAAQFGLSEAAIRRHKQHIPELLLKARDLAEEFEAQEILGKILRLERETLEQLEGAKEDLENEGERRAVLAAIREQRGNIELMARVRQLIDDRPQVNVLIAPHVQQTIIRALEPYADAKLAVADALAEIEEAAS